MTGEDFIRFIQIYGVQDRKIVIRTDDGSFCELDIADIDLYDGEIIISI